MAHGEAAFARRHTTPSMANKQRQPVWLHDNALFRCTAIELSNDAQLIAQLPRLAMSDPAPAVRQTALLRCNDLVAAQHLSHNDPDERTRVRARQLYFSLMAGTHHNAPTLNDRLRLLQGLTDPALVLHLAMRSHELSLREAAQQQLEHRQYAGPTGGSIHVDRADEDPIFNKARSRALLRRAIVTVAHEIESALSTHDQANAWKWVDALERFVADWPVRWPLPHYAIRASRLLQTAPPPGPAGVLPAPTRRTVVSLARPPHHRPSASAA
ncbi:hypothetical protein [Dyella sp. ASV21]|uniref:hypothetical protein n=1 Tax=Dyella sp. ASV21 TaxID=2795114 RepID=UPI0018EDB540|nr:hypothetical protein [Dyella sp. ASV21]